MHGKRRAASYCTFDSWLLVLVDELRCGLRWPACRGVWSVVVLMVAWRERRYHGIGCCDLKDCVDGGEGTLAQWVLFEGMQGRSD